MLPYYRRNFFVLWLATFLASSAWQQVVPFLPLYLQELGVTDNLGQWASIVYSLHYIAAIFFMPYWGKLADRFGRKPLMMRAGIFLATLYMLMSVATSPYHVAIIRFLNGALTGFIPGATALCATNTPKELTARYVASLQTASAVGTIIGPSIGGVLADIFGFRGALQASGIMVYLAVMMVGILVQEKNKAIAPAPTSLWQDVRISLANPVIFGTMLAVGFTAFGTLAIQPVLTLYLAGMQEAGANWLRGAVFSLPGLAFVFSAGLWTRLGERRGFESLIPLGLVLSGFAAAALSFSSSLYTFSLVYLILGIFVAALRPAAAALVALRVEEEFQSRAYAMQQSAFMFGGFIGPLLAGAVGGVVGTRWMFSWLGLFLIASALVMRRSIKHWTKTTRPAAPAPVLASRV